MSRGRNQPGAVRRAPIGGGARRVAWAAGVVIAVAAALTAWAGTRPSFDAYGWLTWGHMTLHGGLDTNAAPSWKPLPYLFTLVFGVFGPGVQWRLWMATSIAVSLAGLVWSGRLAWRLSEAGEPGADGPAGPWHAARRIAPAAAAALAVVGLLCLRDEFGEGYLHYILSAQTDPMIVACVLGALDCRLHGRERSAFGLLVLAALGRPESWPLLVLDGWWLWRRRPGFRWAVATGAAAVALLWFGVPALSARSWFVAGENALASGGAPHGNRVLGTLQRFTGQLPWPLAVAAVAAVGLAVLRRDRLELALGGAIVVWVALEVVFALHGWPAFGRYMFEPAAIVVVLGAAFVGRLLGGLGVGSGRAAAGALALGVALAACLIPIAVVRGRQARAGIVGQRARTASIDALSATIGRLGGAARIRACGEAISDGLTTQTVLAFDLGRNVSAIGYRFPQPGHRHNPVVVFTPRGRGWVVRTHRQVTAACRALSGPGARGTARRS